MRKSFQSHHMSVMTSPAYWLFVQLLVQADIRVLLKLRIIGRLGAASHQYCEKTTRYGSLKQFSLANQTSFVYASHLFRLSWIIKPFFWDKSEHFGWLDSDWFIAPSNSIIMPKLLPRVSSWQSKYHVVDLRFVIYKQNIILETLQWIIQSVHQWFSFAMGVMQYTPQSIISPYIPNDGIINEIGASKLHENTVFSTLRM